MPDYQIDGQAFLFKGTNEGTFYVRVVYLVGFQYLKINHIFASLSYGLPLVG